MGKLKRKYAKRILAYILSGAMIMSNMTAFASEVPKDAGEGYYEEVSDVDIVDNDDAAEEVEAEEDSKNDENASSEVEVVETTEVETTEVGTTAVETTTVDEQTSEVESSLDEETEKEDTTSEVEETVETDVKEVSISDSKLNEFVDKTVGEWTKGDNGTESRETKWDFSKNGPEANSSLSQNDNLKGIVAMASGVSYKAFKASNTDKPTEGFCVSKTGIAGILLDTETTSVALQYTLTGTTSGRKIKIGGVEVDHAKSYDSADTELAISSDDDYGKYLKIEGIEGSEEYTKSGDTKFATITIIETRPVSDEGGSDDDKTEYVEEGTIDFKTTNIADGVKGVSVEDIVDSGSGHGLQTKAANAAMKLNLSGKAVITVETCRYGAGAEGTMESTSGEVTTGTVAEGDSEALVFTVTGANDRATLTFASNMYIHNIVVEYINDADSVEEGTIDFKTTNIADGVKGVSAENIVDSGSGHGLQTKAANATMQISLSGKAIITVETCQYGAGAGGTMTSTSGKVTTGTVAEGSGEAPVFTVVGANDRATLTFASNMYIHNVSIHYLTESEYTVVALAEGSGTASADKNVAAAGDKITLTATPESGYGFKEWVVVNGDITIAADNTFTMPAGDVEVKAVFEEAGPRKVWDFTDTTDTALTEFGAFEGNSGEVEGLQINAQNGKFAYNSAGYVQVNPGTVIKVPVGDVETADGVKVTVQWYVTDSKYTVAGQEMTSQEHTGQTFECKGTDGYVEIVLNEQTNYLEVIKIDPIEYVKAGTYNFTQLRGAEIEGFTFDKIADKKNSHGYETTDAGASITLSLSDNANIILTGCRYGSGPAVELTASSGEVTKAIVTGEGADAPEFTVKKAEAGDLTLNLTYEGTMWIHSLSVEYLPKEVPDVYTDGIDVWDFGAEQLASTDEVKYNNKLTEDIINSWYPEVAAGSTGKNIASFEVKDADGNTDFMFNDGGYSTTHRLRTTNTKLTRYDEKTLKIGDTIYSGYLYSNKSSDKSVYIGVKLNAGDIMTAVVSSNGSDYTVTVEDPDGNTQNFEKSSGASMITYYATKSGIHKIYNGTNEKLVVGRVTRQHNQKVTVSGTATVPRGISDELKLVFTCKESGMVREAVIENGKYEVELYENYHYDVIVSPTTYVISSGAELELGAANETLTAQHDVVVKAVSLYTLSGSVNGLDDSAMAAVNISFDKPEENLYQPVIALDKENKTYTVELESGVEYTIITEGINDYELDSSAGNNSDKIKITADTMYRDITYTKKPVYKITIAPEGATTDNLKDAKFTFENLNEEGYVYTFTGTENIELRDGTYSVVVSDSGIYVQQLTSNLEVNGAPVTKKIPFKSDITEWIFSEGEGFTKETCDAGLYNGLKLTGVRAESGKAHAVLGADSKIEIPVKGNCVVEATYYYAAAGTLGDVAFEAHEGEALGSTSKTETAAYSYVGDGGYVELTTSATTYLTKIVLKTEIAYQETITVDPSKAESETNFLTINDALDAVRKMDRKDGNATKTVTINITPGDYEEMLVIDIDNVKLVNAAGKNASIELKNKGVDIDKNAVRITSYYGHGYNYYSMGSDCKWNADILEANKANGHESFINPGSGTTNGSYWNATVVISGSNVSAEGIIFENSFNQYVSKKAADDIIVKKSDAKEGSVPRATMAAGDTTVQNKEYVERAAALAITNNCSQISFDNCKFIGRQDTLYGGTGVTAAFYDCAVYGGTDYIFGGMKAVFAKCDLVFNTDDKNNNDVGYITAAQQSSGRGYLMYNCHVTSTVPGVDTASAYTSKPGYFGRPWQANTGEAVFYKTIIDKADAKWQGADGAAVSLIQPIGWNNTLSGESALSQEYGTYEVAGVDNLSKRAAWATVLTEEKLKDGSELSVGTFLGDWDAFAGKDMTIVMPDDANVPNPEAPKAIVTPEPSDNKVIVGANVVLAAEAGAKVYYNVNTDANPTTDSELYTKEIEINDTILKEDKTVTIKAVAEMYGKLSKVATFTYTATDTPTPEKPSISVTPEPVDGDIEAGARFMLSAQTGAEIYYNINTESDPTTESAKYAGKVGVEITKEMVQPDSTVTIKAISVMYGKTSAVETVTYSVTVSAPVADYKSGTQFPDGGGKVKLTADEGTTIYYTMSNEGTPADPTTDTENRQTYDAAGDGIAINKDTTISAVAQMGTKYSKVVTLKYMVNLSVPNADPASGTKFTKNGGKVKLSADEGTSIYYTMGSNPSNPITDTENRQTYDTNSDGIAINETVTINAVAEKDGRYSAVAIFNYTITVSFATSPSLTGNVSVPSPGNVLTVNYKLDTEGTDTTTVEWYRVNGDKEILVASGMQYTVQEEDIDSIIRVVVTPNIENGIAGNPKSAETKKVRKPSAAITGKGLEIVLLEEDYTYTGSAIIPEYIVINNGIELTEGVDYTVKCSNNIRVADGKARVVIYGKGNYRGNTYETFNIKPKNLALNDIEGLGPVSGDGVFVAENTKVDPVLSYGGVKLTGRDFEFANSSDKNKKWTSADDGSTVTINGKGNFTGSRELNVTVISKEAQKAAKIVVKLDKTANKNLTYTGDEIYPTFTVTNKGMTAELVEDVDYVVSYPNDITSAGKKKFTVIGISEDCVGTATLTYTIKPALKNGTVTVALNGTEVTAATRLPFVSTGVVFDQNELVVTYDGTELALGRDYKITYSGNKKVGSKAKYTISGQGNYKGIKKTGTFTIDTAAMSFDNIEVIVPDKIFNKPGTYKSTPYVIEKSSNTLLKSSNYKVSYWNNAAATQPLTKVTAAGKTIYVKIEGKGGYSNTTIITSYEVKSGNKNLATAKITFFETKEAQRATSKLSYTGDAVKPYSMKITFKDRTEVVVVLDETAEAFDQAIYDQFNITFVNNVNKGRATVVVTSNNSSYVGGKTATYNIVTRLLKDLFKTL